ncbi:hypothetical protein MJO28_009858 [Puccinia striiformis f. sp. tritici]|nr:hypothetical protein MJO28_009858 [Puccinia striiformis f. sp. tritici]
MVNFLTFAVVATAFTINTVQSKRQIAVEHKLAPSKVQSAYTPLQVTRAQVIENSHVSPPPESSNSTESTPTPVNAVPQKMNNQQRKASDRIERRQSGRLSFKQIRVHAYLADCLNAILPHTQLIRSLCAEEANGDAEKLGWNLVAHLQAILEVMRGCLSQIQNCGTAPSPSGAPGSTPPSLGDICQIFFKIMCEIRDCCLLIGALCSKYAIVRQVCQDTLTQITGCLSSMTVSLNGQVGNVSSGLGSLIATVPHFFVNVQFGFQGITGLLGNLNGLLSLNTLL